ncbi:hypothetical protein ACWNT8_10630 [Pigmentibacter ruber]
MSLKKQDLKIFIPVLILFLFNYLYFIYDVHDSYEMLGDQSRDWRIASSKDIQLIGTSISSGGNSLGPIFYWLLQLTYHILGPFFNYLPHIAVYSQSFFFALANSFLFYSLAKKYNQSLVFIFSLFILYITSPILASMAGLSWNPNYATMFINLSLAFAIYKNILSNGYEKINKINILVFITLSWFSVQCHSPALFYFLASMLFILIKTKSKRLKFEFLFISVILLLILQIPFIIHTFSISSELNNYVGNTGTATFIHKFLLFQGGFGRGFIFLMNDSSLILFQVYKIFPLLIIYLLTFIKVFFFKLYKDYLVQFFLLYIFITYYGFSCIPSYDRSTYLLNEHLFIIAILPIIILFNGAIKNTKINLFFQTIILLIIISLIPYRYSKKESKMEFYSKLVSASEKIFMKYPEIRSIVIPKFPLAVDSTIIYEGFGGKISEKSNLEAKIDINGNISYNTMQ